MPTVYTEVEVDVSLDDFDDYDLIDELTKRGRGFEVDSFTPTELLNAIYEKRRNGKDYQRELDDLIYVAIGRIS
jgi:hypothetical protein